MNPKSYLKVLILLPAFAGAVSPALSAPQSSKTGTYTFEPGNGAGGVVMVKGLSKDKIKFQIECNRGAPSYNVGAAEGTIEVKNNIAIYSANYPDYSEGG